MIPVPRLNVGDTISIELINWISKISSLLPVTATTYTATGVGVQANFQSPLGLRRVSYAVPRLTTWDSFGITPAAVGTAIATALGGSLFQQTPRVDIATGGAAGNANLTYFGLSGAATNIWRGNAAGLGGFYFRVVCGYETFVATARMFVGLFTGANPGAVNPSSLTDCLFFGNDGGDANMQIMTNDSVGTCTKIDLGANFPANTSTTDLYAVEFYAAPNGSTVSYYVTRLNTGATASGTLSTDLLSNTAGRFIQTWVCNGSTASIASLAVGSVYLEQPT